ncbi:hypothetical protein [Halegenticoccus tardaugens]|uniref:hypothetical protein n=1 Tax=Halegenticoccus tardaugens TaxID=2071624 RepID=UPI0013E93521|nr:hypothetical protein [Halegenticoccus tardaugens]
MPEHPSYVCRACDCKVSPAAYRAACPECGGGLRPATPGWRRRPIDVGGGAPAKGQ